MTRVSALGLLLMYASCSSPGTQGSTGGTSVGSGGVAGTSGSSTGRLGTGGNSSATSAFASGGTSSGGGTSAGSSAAGGSGGRAGLGGSASTGVGSGGSLAPASGGTAGTREDAGIPSSDALFGDVPVDLGLQPDRISDIALAADTGDDPNAVDVYLIGGQSNADGQGYSNNLPAGFTINTKVQIYYSADKNQGVKANTWIPNCAASGGVDFCNLGATFGPELGFGNTIQAFYPNRQIGLIKHSKSGTNLYSQWAPGSSPTDTANFGPEFKTFVNTVDGGLKALKSKGLNPVIRGMLWQQGEADADNGGMNYGPNLKAFIGRMREQFNAPDMLFVYGYVYPVAAAASNQTGRDVVRAAEKNIDQDSGNALATRRAFVVETDDLELRAQDPHVCGMVANDTTHFGTAGQLELGKRMATKVHDKL